MLDVIRFCFEFLNFELMTCFTRCGKLCLVDFALQNKKFLLLLKWLSKVLESVPTDFLLLGKILCVLFLLSLLY